MTQVPDPDVPCFRVRLIGQDDANNDWGVRFYLQYTGGPPTGADCTSLASGISGAFATDLAPLVISSNKLTEVDVLDIANDRGLSGQSTTPVSGSLGGNANPVQVAFNIEYGIARRYRGGKPRGYWPFGGNAEQQNQSHWTTTFVNSVETQIEAFFTAVAALSTTNISSVKHVNLSYYQGFKNVTNSSGRERAVPTYRPTALHDPITSYIARQEMSSQRRRRVAVTP